MINIELNKDSNYTVVEFSHKDKFYVKYYDVVCICGKKKKLTAQYLKKNISCGCQTKNTWQRTHGLSKTSEYKTWLSMKSRCLNVNDPVFSNYGMRGVKVCDEWLNSFENFINDMGMKPNNSYSIDRIDVNGNYEKSNCRWATMKTQGNNRRTNVFLEYDNKKMTLVQWAEYLKIPKATLKSRHRANKPVNEILKEYKNG